MEFLLIDPTGEFHQSIGAFTFSQKPMIGEWIEVTQAESTFVYEVLMVVHSTDCQGIDIYVKRLGELSDLLDERYRDKEQDGLLTWIKFGGNPPSQE